MFFVIDSVSCYLKLGILFCTTQHTTASLSRGRNSNESKKHYSHFLLTRALDLCVGVGPLFLNATPIALSHALDLDRSDIFVLCAVLFLVISLVDWLLGVSSFLIAHYHFLIKRTSLLACRRRWFGIDIFNSTNWKLVPLCPLKGVHTSSDTILRFIQTTTPLQCQGAWNRRKKCGTKWNTMPLSSTTTQSKQLLAY